MAKRRKKSSVSLKKSKISRESVRKRISIVKMVVLFLFFLSIASATVFAGIFTVRKVKGIFRKRAQEQLDEAQRMKVQKEKDLQNHSNELLTSLSNKNYTKFQELLSKDIGLNDHRTISNEKHIFEHVFEAGDLVALDCMVRTPEVLQVAALKKTAVHFIVRSLQQQDNVLVFLKKLKSIGFNLELESELEQVFDQTPFAPRTKPIELTNVTPLIHAIRNGNHAALKALLQLKVNTDYSKQFRCASLLTCAMQWKVCDKTIQILIETGAASPFHFEANGLSPFHVAVIKTNSSQSSYFKTIVESSPPPPMSPQDYRKALAQSKTQSGQTPLHLAVEHLADHKVCIPRLLEMGADMNAPDSSGISPLQYAQKINNSAILKIFKETINH